MKKIYDCDHLSFERYQSHETEYRTTQMTFPRAAQFTAWQQYFLKSFSKIPNEILWCAAIHLIEGICAKEDFEAIQSNGITYRTQGGVRLEWTLPDGSIAARELSSISVIALERSGSNPRCSGMILSQLKPALAVIAPELPKLANTAIFFQCCAQAWAFVKLPQFLFAYVIGDAPMCALGRKVLSRRDSTFALSEFLNSNVIQVDEDFALDGYFHNQDKVEKISLVDKISNVLSMANPHGLGLRQLQMENAKLLRTLTNDAEASGPISCLILSHCIQMLNSGDHALASQIAYIKYGAAVVFRSLVGLNLEQLNSKEFSNQYANGLSALSGENLRKAKAYVGHFHTYIRDWLDVPALQQSVFPNVPASHIDANVVWCHERELLQKFIKQQSDNDERLSEQTSLIVELLYACKARGKELFLLQIRNIRVSAGVVEIEIVSWGRLNGLKSDAAQRVIIITNEKLAARMLGWWNMRLSEGATSHDLLFGTKGAPKRCYRLGLMYPWLNQTLKIVTGDSNSSLHHLRHSGSDETFAALKFDSNFHNAIDQLVVDMGHSSLNSTKNYLHSFPLHLRDRLNAHLYKLYLSSAIVDSLSGISQSAIRKRNERSRIKEESKTQTTTVNNSYWSIVSKCDSSIQLSDSSTETSYCCPWSCPPMNKGRPFSLIDLSWVLRDIQNGYSQHQASRQRGVNPDVVEKVCRELLRLGNKALRARGELRGVRMTDPQAALVELGVDLARVWQPKLESWLRHLDGIMIPILPEIIWECWEDAKFGNYIEISYKLRSELWLGFLVALKFPTSKMVIKQITLDDSQKEDLESCVLLSIGQGSALSPAVAPRIFIVKSRDGRPDIYLQIANEDEKVTDHTGAAFDTLGLKALMTVIHVASVAVHGRHE